MAVAVGVVVSLAGAACASTTGTPAPTGSLTATTAPAKTTVLGGTWKLLPKAPVSGLMGNWSVSSVWTGLQLIVHAMADSPKHPGVTFAYRPATSSWTSLPNGPTPWLGQGGDAAVWTGSQMVVFGLTAGVYTPATNTWRSTEHPSMAPNGQTAGWTRHEVVVWDEGCCGMIVNTAETYNPATGTWTKRTAPLERRSAAMGAWTGKELVVAGGFKGLVGRVLGDAAAYDPAAGTWRRLPPMPEPRGGGKAVWDGREVLFLGGSNTPGGPPVLRGMAFNPTTSKWRMLAPMRYPRNGFAAVWTGRKLMVWGGLSGHAGAWRVPPYGEAFDPATNLWSRLPADPLRGRMVAVAVWTGGQMIVWGGELPNQPGAKMSIDGAAFTPNGS